MGTPMMLGCSKGRQMHERGKTEARLQTRGCAGNAYHMDWVVQGDKLQSPDTRLLLLVSAGCSLWGLLLIGADGVTQDRDSTARTESWFLSSREPPKSPFPMAYTL